MTLFVLKMIAVLAMTVDHVGNFFFPGSEWMILIGRVAFPIFAWGIANGYRKTRHISAYALRLGIVGIISQIPYSFAFSQIGRSPYELNILITLLCGLGTIVLYERVKNPVFRTISIVLIMILGSVVNMSYGWYGIALVLLFHITFETVSKRIILCTIATVVYVCMNSIFVTTQQHIEIAYRGMLQLGALVALIPISMYSGAIGRRGRNFFYLYYPVHLAVIGALYYLMR